MYFPHGAPEDWGLFVAPGAPSAGRGGPKALKDVLGRLGPLGLWSTPKTAPFVDRGLHY